MSTASCSRAAKRQRPMPETVDERRVGARAVAGHEQDRKAQQDPPHRIARLAPANAPRATLADQRPAHLLPDELYGSGRI